MSAESVTREDFKRLVDDLRAELAEVTEARRRQFFKVPRYAVPKSWEAYPWARDYANADTVVELTGLTRTSVRLFDSQARVAREKGNLTHSVLVKGGGRVDVPRRLMPPSVSTGRHRKWMLGELALWMAIREDRQAVNQPQGPDLERIAQVREIHERDGEVTGRGIAAELGVDPQIAAHLIAEAGLKSSATSAHYATGSQLLDVAREAVRRHGPGVEVAVIGKKIQAAGLHASPRRIGPALIQARAEHVRAAMEPSTGSHGAELESMRADGLVTGVQIAEAFGITEGAVTQARKRREIRTVKWEPYGGDGRPLYDPARLAVRKDGQKGPVDVGSPLAADMGAGQ
jgi:hypothetical protein